MGKKNLDQKAKKLHLGKLRAHVLVCSAGKCASKADSERAIGKLKKRLRERGLTGSDGGAMCSAVDCLHICAGGPIAVVWPDGTWYRDATAKNLDRILEEHILGGKVVKDLRIAGPKRVKVA